MDFLRLSKISIYSILAMILFGLGLYGFIGTMGYWHLMDLSYDHTANGGAGNVLDLEVQFRRILAWGCLVLSILIWVLTFMNIMKIEDDKIKKIYMFSGGIFTWLMFPFTFLECTRNNYYQKYLEYISQDYTEVRTISFEKTMNRNLLLNTIFGVFVWVVSIVGFLFIFLTEYDYDAVNPKTNFLIGELSYFTNLNNWWVTIFMTGYLFFNRKLVFKNNTVMIGTAVYIFVVCVIFWGLLFPWTPEGIELDYKLSTEGPTRLISTIWVHAITPILFVIFAITSMFISREAPKSFLQTISKLIVFPIVYGVYVFIIPFFAQFSVYGNTTNLNPNCIPYYDKIYNDVPGERAGAGSVANIGILIGLVCLFIILILVFWLISMKISKQSLKTNWK
ncbi:MAG: DUF1600 domain-containing protein [Mycoplasmoidaceae bacterium]